MKGLVAVCLVYSIASTLGVAQNYGQCLVEMSQPQNLPIQSGPVPVVIIYVDFPDGRLADGSPPVLDSDLNLVANLDAVGSMGYTNPITRLKKARKYVYEDYWDMMFSSDIYSGTVHPDYSTHQYYNPPPGEGAGGNGPYDLTVYGSVYDYWNEVSYGHLQIQAYQTRSGNSNKYHTGIVNRIDVANGKNYIRWITLDLPKSNYGKDSPKLDPIGAALSKVHALHQLPTTDANYIEFDTTGYPPTGKIAVVTAGGILGGWAYVGRQNFILPEKMDYLTNYFSSVIFDGITGLAHEFGHTIGLGHEAVGSWDIMHWGGFGDRSYYFCPPHLNVRAKLQAHWLTGGDTIKIGSTTNFALYPITSAQSPKVAIVKVYGDGGRSGVWTAQGDWKHSEYYLLEYRKREKFNRFAGGPAAPQGFTGGVLIWEDVPNTGEGSLRRSS